MEMEQRVGRVHRFGSRDTILVDTIVVRDSREAQAWRVARERLREIASTLGSGDRFETVFSRVMCLIPPEELQTVLINSPASPLDDAEVTRLSTLVDSGFRNWQAFHDRYAANQRQVRDQPAGLATWESIRDFLIRFGGAQPVNELSKSRFVQNGPQVQVLDESAEVLKLPDGSLHYVGDFDGGLFTGPGAEAVGALGLNVPQVADLLRTSACPTLPTGVAYLRWGEVQSDLRKRLGDEVVILSIVRQIFRFDSVGGIYDAGTELFAYSINDSVSTLTDIDRATLFDMIRLATIRVRPVESPLTVKAATEEARLINELQRPSVEAIRQGIRYAVWPVLALHISP
jgi:hypothetical protein